MTITPTTTTIAASQITSPNLYAMGKGIYLSEHPLLESRINTELLNYHVPIKLLDQIKSQLIVNSDIYLLAYGEAFIVPNEQALAYCLNKEAKLQGDNYDAQKYIGSSKFYQNYIEYCLDHNPHSVRLIINIDQDIILERVRSQV